MLAARIWIELPPSSWAKGSRRPYETLENDRQQALLQAAAMAVQLASAGEIRPLGSLAYLVTPPQEPDVYDGNPPVAATTVMGAR